MAKCAFTGLNHPAQILQANTRNPDPPLLCTPQIFSLLLAAAVHDLAHPGATNDFLNRSRDPLTEQYGAGGGVNERHHVGAFFSTCQQGGVCVLSSLLGADCEEVRTGHERAECSE